MSDYVPVEAVNQLLSSRTKETSCAPLLKVLQIDELRRYIESYVVLDRLWEVMNKAIRDCSYYSKYWKLTRLISLKYHEDFHLRERIHSLVADPTRQIALNLSRRHNISDVSSLGNVHTLHLSNNRKQ